MHQKKTSANEPQALTNEQRRKLLARVYALILSPEWQMDTPEPAPPVIEPTTDRQTHA